MLIKEGWYVLLCRLKGSVSEEGMRRYLPQFKVDDAAEKLAKFEKYISKYKDMMIDVYEVYRKEEEEANHSKDWPLCV